MSVGGYVIVLHIQPVALASLSPCPGHDEPCAVDAETAGSAPGMRAHVKIAKVAPK